MRFFNSIDATNRVAGVYAMADMFNDNRSFKLTHDDVEYVNCEFGDEVSNVKFYKSVYSYFKKRGSL